MKNKSDLLRFLVERGYVHQMTNEAGFDEALLLRSLKGYIGFDCTASSLHVGSLIQIMMLRALQKFDHTPIVLLGGGTTMVGDPSGKDELRSVLSIEQIANNKASINQVFAKFIDCTQNIHFVDNADWLCHLNYLDFLSQYGRYFSINRMLTFDSVKIRLEREQPLTFLEFNYMLLQAYDFLELYKRYGCELQLGGSDQWGNIVNGIELVKRTCNAEVFGLTSPLLTTANGQKMGKTANGAVWLNEQMLSCYDYWQFWRNVDDADVIKFLKLFTEISIDEIEKLSMLQGAELNEAKIILANHATALCHGIEAAEAAMHTARKVFTEKSIDESAEKFYVNEELLAKGGVPVYKLFVDSGLCASGNEAKRLIAGRGAKLNNQLIDSDNIMIDKNHFNDGKITLSAGKKKHVVVILLS